MRLTPGQGSNQLALIASLLSDLKSSNSGILSKLGQLNIDLPRFSYSKVFVASLTAGTIAEIVPAENKSRRTTLAFASGSASKVSILHGFADTPTFEDFAASPWHLTKGGAGIDDLDGGYRVWALALDGEAQIKVGLEYENNSENVGNMNISTLIGTGANWDDTNNWSSGYSNDINNSMIAGYKLFAFDSFSPGESYQFTINPGGLTFDSAIAYPINIYLFEIDSIVKSLLWRFFQNSISYTQLREQVLPIVKNGRSWVARLPASGGIFNMVPKYTQFIGLIDGKILGETYAQTLILNYAPDTANNTGTFTLEGY